ncbi:hypothetical protein Gotur_028695 [Gossypium turneri]
MRLTKKEGLFKGVKASRSGPQVTHLLFIDDCILFGELSRKGALAFREILSEYKRCSGQCVNFAKSTVFFSKNMIEEERQLFINLLRVRSSNEPERYLGLPNIVGRKKKQSFQALKDRLNNRLKIERVGRGDAISIWTDRWIPGIEPETWQNRGDNGELALVSDIIDSTNKKWKKEIITTTFQRDIAKKILQIPLTRTDCEDMQVWKGELSGEFSVRSAYKLLQEASLDPSSYLNYIPSLVNIRYKRVATNAGCPRATLQKKTATTCLGNIRMYGHGSPGSSVEVQRSRSAYFVAPYGLFGAREISEMELRESIQFDVAFDISNSRLASEIIARGQNGEIKFSKSTLHSNVSSPFVAEAYARLEATKLGINMGLDSITIMGDLKTIINKCQTTVRDKSILGAIIYDIQSNKSRFQKIIFRFIQRTENFEAHDLAKEALSKGEERYLVGGR